MVLNALVDSFLPQSEKVWEWKISLTMFLLTRSSKHRQFYHFAKVDQHWCNVTSVTVLNHSSMSYQVTICRPSCHTACLSMSRMQLLLAPSYDMTHTHTLNETTQRNDNISYAVVTRKVKLFQNYFSLCRRPSELIMPEIISKLFQRLIAAHEYFPTCWISLK